MMTGPEVLEYIKKKFIRTDKDTEIYEAITDVVADIKYDTKLEAVKEEAYISPIAAVGEYQILLPSDFGNLVGDVTVVDVDNNSARELNKISKQKYDEKYSDRLYSSVSDMHDGYPLDYCIYAGQIYYGPVADKTTYKFQLNYSTYDTSEISASTTSVPFTSNYKERNVLRQGVMSEMHDLMENYEEANYWRTLYVIGKQNMVEKDQRNVDDKDTVVYHGF
jgi:hypothetical protein